MRLAEEADTPRLLAILSVAGVQGSFTGFSATAEEATLNRIFAGKISGVEH